jgi:hypothetical protein
MDFSEWGFTPDGSVLEDKPVRAWRVTLSIFIEGI